MSEAEIVPRAVAIDIFLGSGDKKNGETILRRDGNKREWLLVVIHKEPTQREQEFSLGA